MRTFVRRVCLATGAVGLALTMAVPAGATTLTAISAAPNSAARATVSQVAANPVTVVTGAQSNREYRKGYRHGAWDGFTLARTVCSEESSRPELNASEDYIRGYNDGFRGGFNTGFRLYC